MKLRASVIVFLVCAVVRGAEVTPIVVPSFGPRFREIQERVDALYHYRNGKYPVPDPQVNLFRTAADLKGPVENPTDTTAKLPVDSDETTLNQAVATLKGGIIKGPDGRFYFSVNQRIYREGDIIQARLKNRPVRMGVKRVSEISVTLSLNAAEVVVPFSASRP